jgi:hypothetical protein
MLETLLASEPLCPVRTPSSAGQSFEWDVMSDAAEWEFPIVPNSSEFIEDVLLISPGAGELRDF